MKSVPFFCFRNVSLYLFLLTFSCSSSTTELPPIVKSPSKDGPEIDVRLTYPDRTFLFGKASSLVFEDKTVQLPTIVVDTTTKYQAMDGFGYTLTGGSAKWINQKLSPSQRTDLLNELFRKDADNIGISYLRISIGASDLDDHVFSYSDLPGGQTDPTLQKFALDPDRINLIPVLKEILSINPEVKIMGSPWSAPKWMKTNNAAKGGNLKKEYYQAYALYFVKYIQEMGKEGISINAITIQNEPENPNNTPSMVMTAEEQNDFIKNHLGPAFKSAGIKTKIILFDHNCDNPNYPIAILNDASTRQFVDGSAFHLYLGEVSALSTVRDAHPDKHIYFTEQWTSGEGDFGGDLRWHIKNLIIGAPRNWSRNVLEWNLAADENFEPHTGDGGCTICLGALTIGSNITRNVSYYIIAHAAKYVRPGSVRVASNIVADLQNVSFVTPEGKKVLIVLNDGAEQKAFAISFNSKVATTSLPPGGVATYHW